MKQNNLNSIINLIEEYDEFLITSHINPDGDNIGSSLALKIFLEQLGKKAEVVIDDQVPNCFSFLPQAEKIQEYNPELNANFEVLFALDSGDFDRIGDVANLIDEQIVINIDHHADNTLYGTYNLVTNAAATGELIYHLIKELDGSYFNQEIAMTIATAIVTDTGSFKYSNTTAQTHQIMADLLEYNIDVNHIVRQIFENNSYQSLKLKAKVLDNLHVNETGEIAWIKVSQKMLEETNATWEDAEGVVGYPRSLKGVEVAVLFKEYDNNKIKVSLRSNEYFPVNDIAHKFDGGGHSKAAGCVVHGNLKEAEEKLITAINKQLIEINKD